MRYILPIILATALSAQQVEIRGTYADPKAFWAAGARLDDYAINAIFVHSGSITPALIERAKAEGAAVYAEFATLNGKGYVEQHPEAWPIDERGERAPAATWFLGACPTEPGFKAHRLRQLEQLLDSREVAGVWMDYFHWHAQFEEPEPILPETCFSDTCLRAFAAAAGLTIPAGSTAEKAKWILSRHERAWRDWRVDVLGAWAREFRDVMRRKKPGALLGVYHCPWTDEEYDGARRRTLGLDLEALAGVVDVFSPMVYHGRMGRPPEWVGEYVEWISSRLSAPVKIWPIVQAHGEPTPISAGEFERVMRLGTSGRASGIMMFTFGSVAGDPAKLASLKRLYRDWAGMR
ncbi:MAG: hypothetical protein KIT09_17525 [Bryobacteraceae bacterium]|nr:hypothetical protein [Bryobacteraceae bacterium]